MHISRNCSWIECGSSFRGRREAFPIRNQITGNNPSTFTVRKLEKSPRDRRARNNATGPWHAFCSDIKKIFHVKLKKVFSISCGPQKQPDNNNNTKHQTPTRPNSEPHRKSEHAPSPYGPHSDSLFPYWKGANFREIKKRDCFFDIFNDQSDSEKNLWLMEL